MKTDMNGRVIKDGDVLVDPKTGWHWTVREGNMYSTYFGHEHKAPLSMNDVRDHIIYDPTTMPEAQVLRPGDSPRSPR